MEADSNSPKQSASAVQSGFPVRRVPLDAPWDWLSHGWRDLCTVPSMSLAYGEQGQYSRAVACKCPMK